MNDKTFKKFLTLILAGVTILGSLVVYLNVDASARSSASSRDSRILSLKYMTHLGRSLWDAASEKSLMISYQELTSLMTQAEAYEKMTHGQDSFLHRLTWDRLKKLRELVTQQGRVTVAPYFNGQSGAFDFFQYYLDQIYNPATELLEQQEWKKNESDFWSSKSSSYTTGIAILAVSAFLLTLSLVLVGKIRYFMAGVGMLLVVAVAGLSLHKLVRSWRPPSSESIRLYARASGTLIRAFMTLDIGGDLSSASLLAGQAGSDIGDILRHDPDYISALQLRAQTRLIKGESLIFSGRLPEGRAEIEGEAADLARVIRSGKQDAYIYMSRGFAELLLGKPEESQRSLEKALALLPEQKFSLGVLKAVALLYAGKMQEAKKMLEESLDHALRRPLASDPLNFRTLIRNIERLGDVSAAPGLLGMAMRLKEASVSISICGQTHPIKTEAGLSPPIFVAPVYDSKGNITALPKSEVFPKFSGHVYYVLPFHGMKSGVRLVQKVYRRLPGQVFWLEQLRLARTEIWKDKADGRVFRAVEYPMHEAGEVLSPGEYRVEFYVEGNLLTDGVFNVRQ
jgi:tetratricopeptide (TPR) repeat protein